DQSLQPRHGAKQWRRQRPANNRDLRPRMIFDQPREDAGREHGIAEPCRSDEEDARHDLRNARRSGPTAPPEMMKFIASSIVSSVGMSFETGTTSRKPLVGFGVLGTKTAASSSPVVGSVIVRVTRPTALTSGLGKSSSTTRFVPSGAICSASISLRVAP